MSAHYGQIAFTPEVDAEQELYGSADFYRGRSTRSLRQDTGDSLTTREVEFLQNRDSFYLSTVGETGWPYVQFRGGPPGFVVVTDAHTVSWADYRGNLQHISTGNLRRENRVAIIAMDYPSRSRLKLFGHARVVRADEDPGLVEGLRHPQDPDAVVERAIVVTVDAFDWNCPQHITPRYTRDEIQRILSPLQHRIAALERENARLRSTATTENEERFE